jgi:uncharacterized membrane protein
MNRMPLAARLLLAAFPKAFRREFGDDIAQAVRDMRRHGGLGRWRVLARLTIDVVRTAPRMRWESLMSNARLTLIAGVISIGLIAAVVGHPMFIMLIVSVLALVALLIRKHDRPIAIEPESAVHWYRWVAAGAASFAAGFVVLFFDGNELTSAGWRIWMFSWATGLVLVVFGLILGFTALVNRRHRKP